MLNAKGQNKKAAVVATGWVGDSIMCSAAAQSLHKDKGYQVKTPYAKKTTTTTITTSSNLGTHVTKKQHSDLFPSST